MSGNTYLEIPRPHPHIPQRVIHSKCAGPAHRRRRRTKRRRFHGKNFGCGKHYIRLEAYFGAQCFIISSPMHSVLNPHTEKALNLITEPYLDQPSTNSKDISCSKRISPVITYLNYIGSKGWGLVHS